jgi:hypothetical protein
VRWPYSVIETAPIDERDIAAVAARALSEASLAGGDYVLTGPAALSHARKVAVIGEGVGGGGRASRVRDHDGGGPHRRARPLLPRLGRGARRQLSDPDVAAVTRPG